MTDRRGDDEHQRRRNGPTQRVPSNAGGGSHMRARTWVIAANYSEPEDYGIPALPEWTVVRGEPSGIAFAEGSDAEPFIRAERPVRVRR